jgi:hypothetical protein
VTALRARQRGPNVERVDGAQCRCRDPGELGELDRRADERVELEPLGRLEIPER